MWLVKNIFCIYKMHLISANGYEKVGVNLLRVKKLVKYGKNMKDLQDGLWVQNISDLVLKELYSIYKIKNPTKEQIEKYKMAEREIFEKYNLSENELKTKNKEVYAKNYVMTTVIKCCRGEKKRRKKNRWIQKKINDTRL